MKAVLVNHRYHPFMGGSEIYIKTLAEWMLASGVDARVVTTRAWDLEYFWDPSAAAVDAPSRETLDGVPVERLDVAHPPLSRFGFPLARRAMGEASHLSGWPAPFEAISKAMPLVRGMERAIAGRVRPDIVVATNLGLEGLALRALAESRRDGARFVLIPFAHVGCGENNNARRYVSMPHHRKLLRAADLILTMTELERAFVEEMGVESHRAVTVGAGISIDGVTGGCARRLREMIQSSHPIVASIGALAADKGACDLVEAGALLARRGSPVDVILIGPELSSFSRWIERRGADRWPWLHRPGVVDDEAKRDVLAAMDVLALPSRTESFGIVYLEAWANRKPVIAARVGAVPEIVEHGLDGYLVPFGDPTSLADAISRMVANEHERDRLGEAGFGKVRQLYTWDLVMGRIASAFERVLGLRIEGAGRT